jgi:pimeloyl-ACP methyl ester carboxylesterase
VTDLHLDSFGDGPPALFVHGSFGWGLETFPEQVALASEYRIMLVDRRGFGKSGGEPQGWPTDMHDIAAILDRLGGAHLVGQSYGGLVALLAAGLRPQSVRSLVAIEPPAFESALGEPAADAEVAALKPVYARGSELTARQFAEAWMTARGVSLEKARAWTDTFGVEEWKAAEASRFERWPGGAPFDYETLAAAPFPKVLVRGMWPTAPELGEAFRVACEAIAEGIGARLAVFEESRHNPQIEEPERFNTLLRDVWGS